jgi:hypothetical protein
MFCVCESRAWSEGVRMPGRALNAQPVSLGSHYTSSQVKRPVRTMDLWAHGTEDGGAVHTNVDKKKCTVTVTQNYIILWMDFRCRSARSY